MATSNVGSPAGATGADFEYDIALSFAGEQRGLAEAIAQRLTESGIKVFYDGFEKANLWGTNLYDHLHEVYFRRAKYCLLIASKEYSQKAWPTHERQSAQARALQEKSGYILPLRVDETEIPGLPSTISYIDMNDETVESVVQLISDKLASSTTFPSSVRNPPESLGPDFVVDFSWPASSGHQANREAEGYVLRWVRADKIETRLSQGYALEYHTDSNGIIQRIRAGDLVLMGMGPASSA